MNPLVSEILDVSARRDTELLHLEELFADDCKCESVHRLTECSGGVVARKISQCGADFNICSNSYAYNLRGIESRYKKCNECGDLTSECWTIRPI